MWFSKREKVTVEELSSILHSAGLDAYNNYKDKGYSGDKWDEFRRKIATELLKNVVIFKVGK